MEVTGMRDTCFEDIGVRRDVAGKLAEGLGLGLGAPASYMLCMRHIKMAASIEHRWMLSIGLQRHNRTAL